MSNKTSKMKKINHLKSPERNYQKNLSTEYAEEY